MNKELYDVLEATDKELKGKLDKESARFLERTLLERKLDGMSHYIKYLLDMKLKENFTFKVSISMMKLVKK